MSQSNVITTSGTVTWYTDKCGISTTNVAVTYQVYATSLSNNSPVGNIYSEAAAVDPESYKEIYVGVGNYLTLTGSGFTAKELGTQTSAQAGVFPIILEDEVITTQSGNGLTTQSGDFLIIN